MVVSNWWCDQRQILRQAWSLCRQRAVLLVCWWLAVTVCVPLVLIIWQLLVAQLHASALPLPGMAVRVLCVFVLADFFMTLLTIMVAKPGQRALALDHCLLKTSAVFTYVVALRCVVWLAVAVGTLLLVWPGLLIAVFSAYTMVDVIQHDVKGLFVLQRVMALWRSHLWQIMRNCAAWYAWVMALLVLTVTLFVMGAPDNGVALGFMVLLASTIMMRCVQAVVASQINQSLVVLAKDGGGWLEQGV